jgi:hypothetical protein
LKTLENNKSRVKDDFKFCEHTFFEAYRRMRQQTAKKRQRGASKKAAWT